MMILTISLSISFLLTRCLKVPDAHIKNDLKAVVTHMIGVCHGSNRVATTDDIKWLGFIDFSFGNFFFAAPWQILRSNFWEVVVRDLLAGLLQHIWPSKHSW